jgi:ketosteroid isomerase-like protein
MLTELAFLNLNINTMTRISLFASSLLLGLLIFSSCNNADNSKPATAEELSQMNRDFAKAINNKDAAAAASLYTEDAIELPPNEATFSGRDKIKKYWQGAIDAGTFNVSVATTSTGSNGDLGYEVGRYELSIKDSTGKITTEHGKYIELLKRDKDGKWKSTHGIWNVDTLALK